MSLIVILAAIGLQWYMGFRFSLKDYDWFSPYVAFLHTYLGKTSLWKGYVGLAAVIVPVVIVVMILNSFFDNFLWGITGLLFSVAVLWYCIDARSLDDRLSSYFEGNKATNEVKEYIGAALPKTEGGIARKVSTTIFLRSLHQVFSVIFWYLILGVIGVALYFTVWLVTKGVAKEANTFKDEAQFVQGVLDWVPVRIVGLSFALMGSFGSVFVYWMKNILAGIDKAEDLVTHYGLISIGANPRESKDSGHKESKDAAELIFRAVIVWVVLVAAVTLASWF